MGNSCWEAVHRRGPAHRYRATVEGSPLIIYDLWLAAPVACALAGRLPRSSVMGTGSTGWWRGRVHVVSTVHSAGQRDGTQARTWSQGAGRHRAGMHATSRESVSLAALPCVAATVPTLLLTTPMCDLAAARLLDGRANYNISGMAGQ